MEIAKGLILPIKADPVLNPQVYYGDPLTAIYFTTADDKYGRITFEKLDSIKISRGEYLPYECDFNYSSCWVSIVHNSSWLKERHAYERDNYGDSYEFGGNVDEMLSDFKHYVFSFHDQFIEVIAKGIWFEEDNESLFGKELSEGHPFLPIPQNNVVKLEAYGLTCQARINSKSEEELKRDAVFCSQRLIEFALELETVSVSHTLMLLYKNNRFVSSLKGYWGKNEIEFDKIARLEDVKPYIELYMKEVAERRKSMGK